MPTRTPVPASIVCLAAPQTADRRPRRPRLPRRPEPGGAAQASAVKAPPSKAAGLGAARPPSLAWSDRAAASASGDRQARALRRSC
jgi:hypothetical protein